MSHKCNIMTKKQEHTSYFTLIMKIRDIGAPEILKLSHHRIMHAYGTVRSRSRVSGIYLNTHIRFDL